MRQLDEILSYQQTLQTLCQLKARPPVIRDLVPPAIPVATIYAIYRYINAEAPPRGQLPQEIRVFLSNPKKRLHTSVLINIWDRFEHLVKTPAERYIKTYLMYKATCGSEDCVLYDFNRAWFIIRQYTLRRVLMRTCPCCGQRYVYNREDVSDIRKCHGCAITGTITRPPSPERTPIHRPYVHQFVAREAAG